MTERAARQRRTEFSDLLAYGFSHGEIATMYGTSRPSVYYFLSRKDSKRRELDGCCPSASSAAAASSGSQEHVNHVAPLISRTRFMLESRSNGTGVVLPILQRRRETIRVRRTYKQSRGWRVAE